MIKDMFGNGQDRGISIEYVHESDPMGTAGPLGLLPEVPKTPAIVINGDILTNLNYRALLQFHEQNDADATMCVRGHEVQIPFGVVQISDGNLQSVTEKPINRYFVNAGVYVLEPRVVALVQKGERIDMTELFDRVVQSKMQAKVFPVREYWLDVGRISDLERANLDYPVNF